MLRLVLGRLDYGGITTGVTFRFTGDARALSGVPDARLNALGKALINRVFRELNINCDSTHLESLSQVFEDCGFAMPASVKFTSEFNTDELKAILHSAPISIIEPISTIIGLALASSLRVNVEFYSDLWPRLTDALAQLKALGIDIAVHSSVFDVNRVFIFDEVIRRLVRIPRIDELRETTEFNSRVEVIGVSRRFVEVPARQFSLAEPTEAWVSNDVVNAVEVLIKDLGGVATLKALGDLVGQEAVIKALSMGYVVFNPSDMTVRATTKALTLIRRLGWSSDVHKETRAD
ncbi:hypothetical protein [Vulcanisaeta distributa]|uniref:Uncharacterized protein n=1 Tax=Vulcanisaeta distributa (strain DSM 14429 / JCM 11212 / NBRC 100878 / IC-017) TaxID=572478 RepID=E1QSN1_VULDI|nr:hypothetical protein [Vulcanisaeta distributa]ADN49548.1 hypothetical protein Vdis_0135 [Vulcanisaeta distributa DSM 14429]